MQVANTLAYYDMAIITAVKSFIVLAPGWPFTFLRWLRERGKKEVMMSCLKTFVGSVSR